MAIQNDLSRGSYLITQKSFQIEAWVYPVRFVPVTDANGVLQEFSTQQFVGQITTLQDVTLDLYLEAQLANNNYVYYQVKEDFDLSIWDNSEFTSFMTTLYTLDNFQKDIGNRAFSPLIDVNKGDLTALEQSKLDNIIRIQWHDDDLHPNNSLVNGSLEPPSIIGLGGDYFDAKKLDPAYDNVLLSIDPPPFNYTDAQWTAYINELKPDLILHNNYVWQPDQGLNKRQVEYGMYARAILWSDRAQAGGDALNPVAKPIPWGAFIQTSYLGRSEIMPFTYRKYQAFFYLTFGAKFLSAFVYNDYPNSHTLGIESYLFDQNGEPKLEDPNITPIFFEQAQLNKKLKILGNTLKLLNSTGQRLKRATNIEFNVPQGLPFAGGEYDWDFGTRPDTRLTDVIVSRDDFPTTQDVWVGYFNPIHNSLDGSGTTDETYFMICNGSWSEDDSLNIRQRIRMEFDFGADHTITNLIKLSTETGELEVIPLIPMGGNTYYYEHVLDAGEADLFKYDTGVQFIGDPTPQVSQGSSFEPPFNFPAGFRVSNADPIDADRYLVDTISERNLLVTQGRAQEGQQCYVKNVGDNTSELFVLRGNTNLDWQPIWKSPFQLADMYKQTYDTNNSGVVDNAELLSGRILNELPAPDSVVSRDENGDIEARLFKSTFANQISIETGAAVAMRNDNTDINNFIRFVTKAGFATWLGFNKPGIDALNIDAETLNGRLLNFSPSSNTVAGRDVDGKISAQAFKTADWEIVQNAGILTIKNITDPSIVLSFPIATGTVALRLKEYTVATLPASPTAGDEAIVTDGNTVSYRAAATGGGTEYVKVLYNGTNWIYH